MCTDRAAAVMAGAGGGGAVTAVVAQEKVAQCSGDAGLAGAWLEEAQGSAVQGGQTRARLGEGEEK